MNSAPILWAEDLAVADAIISAHRIGELRTAIAFALARQRAVIARFCDDVDKSTPLYDIAERIRKNEIRLR